MQEVIINSGKNKYTLYSNGSIYTHQRNRFMSLSDNSKGYKFIRMYDAQKYSHEYIHRLVAKYFIPNPLLLPEVNHKDGDKSNNNNWNLEWCTHLENMIHARNNGFFVKEQLNRQTNQITWIGKQNSTRTVIGLTDIKNKNGNYKVKVRCVCDHIFLMYFNDFLKDNVLSCKKCRYSGG